MLIAVRNTLALVSVILVPLATGACQPVVGREQARPSREALLSGTGIDLLRIGLLADSASLIAEVVSDTVEPGDEAEPGRLLRVRFGADTVSAEVFGTRISRILVSTRGLRTADGLGVGSTLGDLAKVGSITGAVAYGGYMVRIATECGLVYQLAYDIPTSVLVGGTADAHLKQLPHSVRVDRVIVNGCD